MIRVGLVIVMTAFMLVQTGGIYAEDCPINFESRWGQRPEVMPASVAWPDAVAFEAGNASAPPFLRVEGYAFRTQQCTCEDLSQLPDGSTQNCQFVYYRVGQFDDGADAFELDLGNGVYLALKVDPNIPLPEFQQGADEAYPTTWKPNVQAAWFGEADERPRKILVGAAGGLAEGRKGARLIYHRATNAVINGADAVTRNPRLDWGSLKIISDVYAADPLRLKPLADSRITIGRAAAWVVMAGGRVLIVGGWVGMQPVKSAVIFDPLDGNWSVTASCHSVQGMHTMSLCGDGRVLLVPGYGSPSENRRPELFDPSTGEWSLLPPTLRDFYAPVSLSLADGRVLVYDRDLSAADRVAEIFDPRSCAWTQTPPVAALETTATLTRLLDGRVLLVGATEALGLGQPRSIARIFDPSKDIWSSVAAPQESRQNHTATLLMDGRVLVAGGAPRKTGGEIYDPAADSWNSTGPMAVVRGSHGATLLPDGRVLVIGGRCPMPSPPDLPVGEIFEPKTGRWSGAGKSADVRELTKALTLKDGSILVLSAEGKSTWLTIAK